MRQEMGCGMSHPHSFGHHHVAVVPVVPIMPMRRPVVVMGPGVGMRRGFHGPMGHRAMGRPMGRPMGGRRRF
jgi:hypothetical protein